MIYDNIKNVNNYNLSTNVLNTLKYVAQFSADNYPANRIDLENGDYILPSQYTTQKKDKFVMEAHKKYIDVMYMVDGSEMIMVSAIDKLDNITTQYDADSDCLLAEESNVLSSVLLNPGDFIILYPQDAHCPACAVNQTPEAVKKIICKIQI